MVQTNEDWWNAAKLMGYVDSQQEMNLYNDSLDKYTQMKNFSMWGPTRSLLFWSKFYMYGALFKWHFRFPSANFNPTRPGLEIKFACEEAEKLGARTYFLGAEYD